MMNNNSQDSLITSGIVGSIGVPFDTPPGFTIPLVKLREGANTTYVQRLDRKGKIVGFEPFDGPIKSIPLPSTYPLSVGDSEVYSLLDPEGLPHVGTKREIAQPIRQWVAQIERPLLRMSFARFVGNNDVATKAAHEAISEKAKEFDSESDAVHWFVAGVVAPDIVGIATKLRTDKAADIDFNSSSVSVDKLGQQKLSVKLNLAEAGHLDTMQKLGRQLDTLRKFLEGALGREVYFEVELNEDYVRTADQLDLRLGKTTRDSQILSDLYTTKRQEGRLAIALKVLTENEPASRELLRNYVDRAEFARSAISGLVELVSSKSPKNPTEASMVVGREIPRIYRAAHPRQRGLLLLELAKANRSNEIIANAVRTICSKTGSVHVHEYRDQILSVLD